MKTNTYVNKVLFIVIVCNTFWWGCREKNPAEPYISNDKKVIVGSYPVISPLGDKLAYVRLYSLFISDSNGLNEKEIFTGRFISNSIRWSYNGKRIGILLLDSLQWRLNKIITIDVDSKAVTNLTPTDTVNYADINSWDWNGQNDMIAYWAYNYGNGILTVAKGDGSGSILKRYSASEFSWSPDGSQIAFLSRRTSYSSTDTMFLFITNPNADTIRTVITSYEHISALRWTPDNNIIAYSKNYGSLILYDLVQKSILKSLYIESLYPNYYKFSPNGKNIAYTYRYQTSDPYSTPPTNLYSKDIASGGDKLVFTSYPGIDNFNWAPSSRELYYEFKGQIYKGSIE